MRTKWLLVGLALASFIGPVRADDGTAQEQAACRPDVRKLCGNIGTGDEQKYKDCLKSHFADLSQKCQQVLTAHQDKP